MKDTETYIKEIYEKAKTMPEMKIVKVEDVNEFDEEEITFTPEFEGILKKALLEYVNSDTGDYDEYPEVKFSQRHERKMQKIFKMYRKQCLKRYRTKRSEIRKKIAEKKRLKKLKYSDKKNKPSSK